jgi:putative addiction module killer protein
MHAATDIWLFSPSPVNSQSILTPKRFFTKKRTSAGGATTPLALYRIGLGNFSNIKSVGAGILECKIHFGPGYRVYFGKDGEQIVILLGGGTKQRQQKDIRLALDRWEDYKSRKRHQKEEE